MPYYGQSAIKYMPNLIMEEQGKAEEASARGTSSRNWVRDALDKFDPQSFARSTLNYGVLPGVYEEHGRKVAGADVARNRRGMLASGVDEGWLGRDLNTRLSQEMARYGMQAGQMNLQKTGQMQGLAGMESEIGQRKEENVLDLFAGQADREQAAKNAKDAQPKWWEKALGFGLEAAKLFKPL